MSFVLLPCGFFAGTLEFYQDLARNFAEHPIWSAATIQELQLASEPTAGLSPFHSRIFDLNF